MLTSVDEGGQGRGDMEWREPEPSEDLKGSGGPALSDRLGNSHSEHSRKLRVMKRVVN